MVQSSEALHFSALERWLWPSLSPLSGLSARSGRGGAGPAGGPRDLEHGGADPARGGGARGLERPATHPRGPPWKAGESGCSTFGAKTEH